MTTISFDHLLPESFALKPFQTVGVGYAVVARRCFIADEMGLGKTIQALVALEANDAFPAVVVCPAMLKGNWANEIRRFLPHRSVEVVAGRKAYPATADITIVNYDVLPFWADALAQPVALVLDESHYCKNIGSAKAPVKRTAAAKKLAESVPAEGYVLCLTGTPLENRPIELLSQLQIMGRLEDIVAGEYQASNDPEFAFKFAFCRNEKSKEETGKYTWDGAVNTAVLNERLRSTCYVRRLRKDAMGTNDTERFAVNLSLNGALAEYNRAEADLISFKKEEARIKARQEALESGERCTDEEAELAAIKAARKARSAEHIVRLTTLRRLVGEAKIESTVEWIENFMESNPDKSLVIFARHIPVQKGLIAALAAHSPAQILAGQKDVEEQKRRFQARETRLIVLGFGAREGHTLTAASDVLFVEQPWHPGAQQQAEDRCNRIGQEAENVFAWTLLATGTVDEYVHGIIERKRVVFKATADGQAADTDNEDDVIAALDAYFEAKAQEDAA